MELTLNPSDVMKVVNADSVIRESDPIDEAYCIQCGIANSGSTRMFFFNGQGPFDNKGCYASYLGVEEEVLPPTVHIGRLK